MASNACHQTYYVRLMVFSMLAEGHSIDQAASRYGLTPARINEWIESAITYGMHMVIDKPLRRHHLTPEQLSDIGQWLASAPWLSSSRVGWRADHMRREIALRFGVNVTASVAQSLLHEARTPTPDPFESRN